MNADFKNVTVQLPQELLEKVDAMAAQLDLNRSQYFRRLAREDLERAAKEQEQAQPQEKAA